VPVTADDIPVNSITADKIVDGVIEIADVGPVLQAEIDSIYTEDDYIADEIVDLGWAD
jgi:hypothetical protein